MNREHTNTRLTALEQIIQAHGADAILISLYENRRYYSGFTGSNGYLLITPARRILITDRRYTEQATAQTQDVEVLEHGADRFADIAQKVQELEITALMVESAMPAAEYFALERLLPSVRITLAGTVLVEARMVKDDVEIRNIQTAVRLSQEALLEVAALCKAGMTEKDLGDELNYRVARKGAQTMSFGTIVAAGERGAMAHGEPTTRSIRPGEMVVVDFGAQWNGYCADLTRTLRFGEISDEQSRVFDLVDRAFDAALAAVRPGISAGDVEEAHRQVFREAGLEPYALKGLGHGIGLEIHEHPRVVIGSTQTLMPGMVFTIEPGCTCPAVSVCVPRTMCW